MVLSLFTNKTDFLNNVKARQILAEYVYVIMRQRIGCNIVVVAN